MSALQPGIAPLPANSSASGSATRRAILDQVLNCVQTTIIGELDGSPSFQSLLQVFRSSSKIPTIKLAKNTVEMVFCTQLTGQPRSTHR